MAGTMNQKPSQLRLCLSWSHALASRISVLARRGAIAMSAMGDVPIYFTVLSMIFSENRLPLFRIMLRRPESEVRLILWRSLRNGLRIRRGHSKPSF